MWDGPLKCACGTFIRGPIEPNFCTDYFKTLTTNLEGVSRKSEACLLFHTFLDQSNISPQSMIWEEEDINLYFGKFWCEGIFPTRFFSLRVLERGVCNFHIFSIFPLKKKKPLVFYSFQSSWESQTFPNHFLRTLR